MLKDRLCDPALLVTTRDHAAHPPTFLTYLYSAYLVICGDDPAALSAPVVLHGPYAADAVVDKLAPGLRSIVAFALVCNVTWRDYNL